MSSVKVATAETFDTLVLEAAEPVLVDFWAPWCGPCKMLLPALEDLAEEYAGEAQVVKVNVDEQPGLRERFAVATLPTLLLFQGGKLRERLMGVQTRARLSALLEDAA